MPYKETSAPIQGITRDSFRSKLRDKKTKKVIAIIQPLFEFDSTLERIEPTNPPKMKSWPRTFSGWWGPVQPEDERFA